MPCDFNFTEYINCEKAKLLKDFPKNEVLTETFLNKILNFAEEDFEGIPENKVYRVFLEEVRDIINLSFEEKASKSYLRSFWKILDTKDVSRVLSADMTTKRKDVKALTSRMVNFYVYQDPASSDQYRKSEIMAFIDNMM